MKKKRAINKVDWVFTLRCSWSRSFWRSPWWRVDGQQQQKKKKMKKNEKRRRRSRVTSLVERRPCQGDHITKLSDLWDRSFKEWSWGCFPSSPCDRRLSDVLTDDSVGLRYLQTSPSSSVWWFMFDFFDLLTVKCYNLSSEINLSLIINSAWLNLLVSFMPSQL